jgi:hypothetical protein
MMQESGEASGTKRLPFHDMMYFWLIPLLLLLLIGLGFLYSTATRRRGAGMKTEGRAVVDKASGTDQR